MSWLLTTVLKFLSGRVLDKVFKLLGDKDDNKTEVAKAHINAEIEDRKNRKDVTIASMAYRVFWVVWFAFAAPLALWWDAVFFDTIFAFGWGIAEIPRQLVPWANAIFNSLFYTGVAGAGIQAAAQSYLRSRGRR